MAGAGAGEGAVEVGAAAVASAAADAGARLNDCAAEAAGLPSIKNGCLLDERPVFCVVRLFKRCMCMMAT